MSGTVAVPPVFSVTELGERVNEILAESIGPVQVIGEVSDVRISRDTWVNFTLKDRSSAVSCFAHRSKIGFTLIEGTELRLLATPRIYVPYGKYSLNVLAAEPVGEGALRKAYELLLRTLTAEGLLATPRKRPLPRFPERIALITSPDGAAVADVRRVLSERWGSFALVFIPSLVQGMQAASALVTALRTANETAGVDVIILTRGGGSLEDLQAFNDERVARAVVASRSPVIAAIGHERDTTIAELVADVRAATPSNAAQRAVPDRATVRLELHHLQRSQTEQIQDRLRRLRALLDAFQPAAQYVRHRIEQSIAQLLARLTTSHQLKRSSITQWHSYLVGHTQRLSVTTVQRMTAGRARQRSLRQLLASLSPRAVLTRGYSYTTDAGSGRILRSVTDVTPKQAIRTHLRDGAFTSEVLK